MSEILRLILPFFSILFLGYGAGRFRRVSEAGVAGWNLFLWLLFARFNHLIVEAGMPRGDKSKYTVKQERKADHIAEGYEKRGVSEQEAERRAWATVNKDDGGGKKAGGSGRGKETGHPAAHKGGEKGGKASAERSAADRSASAKKAAATRKRNAEHEAHH